MAALLLAGFLVPAGMAVANRSAPAIEVAAALAAVAGWGMAGAPGGARLFAAPLARSGLARVGWAFAALAAASLFWSIDRAATLRTLSQMAPVVVAGVVLTTLAPRLWSREAAARWLWAGLMIAAALIVIEGLWSPPLPLRRLIKARAYLPDLKRSATPLAVLAFPALALMAPVEGASGRRVAVLGLALIVASAMAIGVAQSGSAMLGLVVGLLVYGVARAAPRLATGLLAGAALLALALAPIAAPVMAQARHGFAFLERFHANHRLSIWRAFGERVWERPWLGHGFGASDKVWALPRADGEPDMTARLVIENIHPHSQPLQIWVELGALGAALTAVVIVTLALRLSRDDPRRAAPRLATLAAAFATAIASFGVWQAWWAAVLGVAAAFFAVERASAARS